MDEWQKPDIRLLHWCNYIENVDKWLKKVSGRQELLLGYNKDVTSWYDLGLNLFWVCLVGLLGVPPLLGSWELCNFVHVAGQVNLFFGKCAVFIWAESVLTCLTVGNWDTGWVFPHSATCRQDIAPLILDIYICTNHLGSLCSQWGKYSTHF